MILEFLVFMLLYVLHVCRYHIHIIFGKICTILIIISACCLETSTATLCSKAAQTSLMQNGPSCSLVCLGLPFWGFSAFCFYGNLSPRIRKIWSICLRGNPFVTDCSPKKSADILCLILPFSLNF